MPGLCLFVLLPYTFEAEVPVLGKSTRGEVENAHLYLQEPSPESLYKNVCQVGGDSFSQ